MFYSTQEKLYQRAMQVALGQRSRYHFEWLAPLFSLVPEKYHYLTDPAFDYIKKELYGDLIKFFKTYIRPEMPQILFTLVVRVGKRYCPYHVRWHACFIVTMGFFTQIPWDTARRANRMIYETLLPEYRYQEVEDLQIWIGCLIFAHVSIVCLAMLHALYIISSCTSDPVRQKVFIVEVILLGRMSLYSMTRTTEKCDGYGGAY